MKRYLVLVHLAAAFPKTEFVARATAMHGAMKSLLDNMETVLTAEKAFAFACVSDKSATDLWKAIIGAAVFGNQDNISVVEVGFDISTTHKGLMAWNRETDMIAGLAEFARKK